MIHRKKQFGLPAALVNLRDSKCRPGWPLFASLPLAHNTRVSSAIPPKTHQFAERLYADLQAKGVRCWFAPHQVSGGKKLHEQIDEAIRLYDRLLLLLSEHSMKSEDIEARVSELERAAEESNQHR